jgi:adenylosuccinate synthase
VKAFAVIGAQYGDEGKGLMVDHLADRHGGSAVVVVRSNGGSQAGHTVVTPQGQRHVFSHFGSGSFTGARTHLSRFMVVNPIKFREERMKLLMAGARAPRVTVDPNAMVTLPFDALINQVVETHRGNARHGSCGHGVGETVERNEHADGFPLTVGTVSGTSLIGLQALRDAWVPQRLERLGVDVVPEEYRDILYSDAILATWLEEYHLFDHYSEVLSDSEIANLGTVVFEAAQGLALDAEMGAFPYVTRSNTGLKNIVALSEMTGITALDVSYMTRIYTTRHGAGPLAHEGQMDETIAVVDATNVPNDWQGSLRFAPLDTDFLNRNIERDLDSVAHTSLAKSNNIHRSVMATCLDQASDEVTIYQNGTLECVSTVSSLADLGFSGGSRGPTREHVFVDQNEMNEYAMA